MSDEARKKNLGSVAMLAVVGALVLYALSIGPAYALTEPSILCSVFIPFQSHRWLFIFYEPVFWLAYEMDLGQPLQNYMVRCWLAVH